MGHIRLGILPYSKRWQDAVDLLGSEVTVHEIAEAAAKASELDLSRAIQDPRFQFMSSLLVRLPLLARALGFEDALANLDRIAHTRSRADVHNQTKQHVHCGSCSQ